MSGKPLSADRVKALKMLGIPQERWTVVEHSMESKKQGIYFGEVGTSELKVVKKVYNDSIHDSFSKSKSKYESD